MIPEIVTEAQPFLDQWANQARTELGFPILGVYAVNDEYDDKPMYRLEIVWPDEFEWIKQMKDKAYRLKMARWDADLGYEFRQAFEDRLVQTHFISKSDWDSLQKTGKRLDPDFFYHRNTKKKAA